jgi:hypothetical protein
MEVQEPPMTPADEAECIALWNAGVETAAIAQRLTPAQEASHGPPCA